MSITSETPRKILILGATGPTGRHITSQALARGHEVTVLARSAEKAQGLGNVRLVLGDARDARMLREAVHNQNTVISALGTPASPFREVTLLSTATRALIEAMQAEQVSRLVAISGMGAGDSKGHGGFLFDRLIFPLILRNVYADKDRQEALVRGSGLDWTLVRPAVLNNKPARGTVRALADLSTFHGGTISREDVASFVLDQVSSSEWRRASPLISW